MSAPMEETVKAGEPAAVLFQSTQLPKRTWCRLSTAPLVASVAALSRKEALRKAVLPAPAVRKTAAPRGAEFPIKVTRWKRKGPVVMAPPRPVAALSTKRAQLTMPPSAETAPPSWARLLRNSQE